MGENLNTNENLEVPAANPATDNLVNNDASGLSTEDLAKQISEMKDMLARQMKQKDADEMKNHSHEDLVKTIQRLEDGKNEEIEREKARMREDFQRLEQRKAQEAAKAQAEAEQLKNKKIAEYENKIKEHEVRDDLNYLKQEIDQMVSTDSLNGNNARLVLHEQVIKQVSVVKNEQTGLREIKALDSNGNPVLDKNGEQVSFAGVIDKVKEDNPFLLKGVGNSSSSGGASKKAQSTSQIYQDALKRYKKR